MREIIQNTQVLTKVNIIVDIFSTSILLEALAPTKLSTVSGYKGVKDLNIIHFAYTPNVLKSPLEETAKDVINNKNLRLGSYLLQYVVNASTHPLLKTNTAFGYLMLASPLLYIIVKALVCGDSITTMDEIITKYHNVVIEGLKKETLKDFYSALRKASVKHLGEYFGRIPSVNVEDTSVLENFSLWEALRDSMYSDIVSHEIITGFKRVLEVHENLLKKRPTSKRLLDIITLVHTKTLSINLDTLVLKSKNFNSALLLKYLSTLRTSISREIWERIDNYVRENELNPGSTSDIVAAGLALYQVSTYVNQDIERSTT
ncbi:MAG: triphosphoribosyl-dephospho-CoA synthase [Desulfurococcaceae archaeon TW002]